MKRTITLLAALLLTATSFAQLSTSEKLYQLCKVWGYLKYHHPNTCNIRWNELLLDKLDSVVASSSTASFNSILYNLCLQTGSTSRPAVPVVIQSDTAKNYKTGWFADPKIAQPVRAFLDSVHAHHSYPATNCRVKINDYSNPSYNSYLDFRADSINNIPGFSYSNLKHRMLVYFYYWNTIEYFFPQIEIADQRWDSTLLQLMPDVMAASSDSSFELTLAQVVSRIDDSHGSYHGHYFYKMLWGLDPYVQARYYPRITIARIQQQHVITASAEPGIAVGDIITKIDGLDADTFLSRRMPYMAASNAITKYRNLYASLLPGLVNSSRQLELRNASGATYAINLSRPFTSAQYESWRASLDTALAWSFTRCGYGYVHMGKLARADVARMYSDLQQAPAIIFDIRNYPQGTLWDLKKLLFSAPNVSAQYLDPDLSWPGYYYKQDDRNNFGNWVNNNPYPGRILILVNEQTQSQAEYTAQALRTFPRATIIGSQTAGADGNIAFVDLPGGIRSYWSSLGWYEYDWYNPQRAGVRVDSLVRPTIHGIRNGSDEVLEKALDCLLAVPETERAGYLVQQVPGSLQISSGSPQAFSIRVINMVGQQVARQTYNVQQAQVSTQHLTAGSYLLIIEDAKGGGKKQKIVIQ